MGKDWAKGLTKATDARVARMADSHRGLRYVRRKPVEECDWVVRTSRTLPLGWSEEMAYLVGLTATDGCLVSARPQVNFKSQDRQLVETYLRLLGRTNAVGSQRTRSGGVAYHTQFTDPAWYEWLQGVGLTPRKSLTLGAIDVPDQFLFPLVRGLLDGDGTITNGLHRADTRGRPGYRWEHLSTRFVSASRTHLVWLETRMRRVTGVPGYLQQRTPDPARHAFFELRYGKRGSQVLLPLIYPPGAPCLERKRAIWDAYLARREGRPVR